MSSQFPNIFSFQTLKHRRIATLKTPSSHINCLAVHANLLYASSANEISVYSLSDHSFVDSFNHDPTTGFVKSIAFNQTKIFTAHQDGKIRIWKIDTLYKNHQHISTLPTVKDKFLNFMLPKNYVNVRRHKKKLWIQHWDTVSGLMNEVGYVESLWDHKGAILCLINVGEWFVSGSSDRTVRVWQRGGKEGGGFHCSIVLEGHEKPVKSLVAVETRVLEGVFSICSGSLDGEIRVWEISICSNFKIPMNSIKLA
ncbi:hypothetical protein PVK06_002695 [Gossypium arboreum]|uniref:Uncharacterized protein n=1 Tax=Gossypium arboreum TaxID=29729 RepID=A0ABR0R5G0_GOSAR|nr:hypothetical protein PVK06_002695 [Gossypium arboreum]